MPPGLALKILPSIEDVKVIDMGNGLGVIGNTEGGKAIKNGCNNDFNCTGNDDEKCFKKDYDLIMIEVLKTYQCINNNSLFPLNVDYSMKIINNNWWRMGHVTYGYAMEHNCLKTANKSIRPTDPEPHNLCPICLDNLLTDVISLNGCHHKFHMVCIAEYKTKKRGGKYDLACPLCSIISLPGSGPSPPGAMSWKLSNKHFMMDKNKFTGVLKIKYTIQSGTQMKCHPNPGAKHMGGQFKAYLPLTDDYISLLKLFILSFLDGQTFTVKNIPRDQLYVDGIVWNIEHKYNLYGGPFNFGYPDPSYLERATNQAIALLNNSK